MCWQVGGHNHSLQGHSFLCCFSHYSMVMGSGKLYGNISRADIVSAPQRHPPDLLSSTSLTWDTLTGSIDLILIFLSLILAHGMPVSRPLSVLTPARSGPDAVGSSSSSWVLTMKLSPASSLALSLPMVCQHQGLPMVQYHGPSFAHWVQNLQDGAHRGGPGQVWGTPWCCGHTLLGDLAGPPGYKAQVGIISSDQPEFAPSWQRNYMSGWKGKGSFSPSAVSNTQLLYGQAEGCQPYGRWAHA